MEIFFTFWVFLPRHEGQDGFGVVVRLLLAGRPRVFAVVGQFVHAAQVADGITGGEGDKEDKGGEVRLPVDSSLIANVAYERGLPVDH